MTISLIACISSNGALGKNNELIFNIKEDMKHFKKLTKNNIIVMGSKTFNSIIDMNGKPLPERVSVVLTHNKNYEPKFNEFVFHDVESILKHCKTLNDEVDKKVFIIGGGELYNLFITRADEVYLTIVDKHIEEADTFYPIDLQNELGFEIVEESEKFYSEEYDAYYRFVKYKKKGTENEEE